MGLVSITRYLQPNHFNSSLNYRNTQTNLSKAKARAKTSGTKQMNSTYDTMLGNTLRREIGGYKSPGESGKQFLTTQAFHYMISNNKCKSLKAVIKTGRSA